MLMQNFKSADALGITEEQKDALAKVLVLLETGRLVHQPLTGEEVFFDPVKQCDVAFSGGFNMREWSVQHSCGTCSCIAGSAEMIGNVSFDDYSQNDGLYNLFSPLSIREEDWNKITPAQAARALRNYLTTGNANWLEAIAA